MNDVGVRRVELSTDAGRWTIANQWVRCEIDCLTGGIAELHWAGDNVLSRGPKLGRTGPAYWSIAGTNQKLSLPRRPRIVVHPNDCQGTHAVVAVDFVYDRRPDSIPLDLVVWFSISQDLPSVQVRGVWRHKPGYPATIVKSGRYVLKLNHELFDVLQLSDTRIHRMPSAVDWLAGEPTHIPEARRMRSGVRKDAIEHKYDYAMLYAEAPVFGWISETRGVGIWMINPSQEYIGGGVTKVELTGHLDVNPPSHPILLNIWKGAHFGGTSLALSEGEPWAKTVGPFSIYLTSGASLHSQWAAAKTAARRLADEWPPAWAVDADLPSLQERRTVVGRIEVTDSWTPASEIGPIRIGLAPAPYRDGANSPLVDWQRDGKHYQFWTIAKADGAFEIERVRRGTYCLYVFADGVIGEYRQDNVVVECGPTLSLGTITWRPQRYGRPLWCIGRPDRTAGKFRHGDDYWHCGLYYRYVHEFPNEVRFEIARSDVRRDWNYVQPGRITRDKVYPTTWTICFELEARPKGSAVLRVAIAGSKCPGGITIGVNSEHVDNLGPLPDTGVMHRDGIRGWWHERICRFPAALLRSGQNEITLRLEATRWSHGVLYDCVCLEVNESEIPKNPS